LIDALAEQNDGESSVPDDAFSMLARQPQQQLAAALAEVRGILAGSSIQARCLECPPVAPARLDQRDLTLLEFLKSWLN
jgi:protease IV